ncbi:MAG TPA: hypothetical protein VIJ33_10760 [Solirubrobacteraceae bacterium]
MSEALRIERLARALCAEEIGLAGRTTERRAWVPAAWRVADEWLFADGLRRDRYREQARRLLELVAAQTPSRRKPVRKKRRAR